MMGRIFTYGTPSIVDTSTLLFEFYSSLTFKDGSDPVPSKICTGWVDYNQFTPSDKLLMSESRELLDQTFSDYFLDFTEFTIKKNTLRLIKHLLTRNIRPPKDAIMKFDEPPDSPKSESPMGHFIESVACMPQVVNQRPNPDFNKGILTTLNVDSKNVNWSEFLSTTRKEKVLSSYVTRDPYEDTWSEYLSTTPEEHVVSEESLARVSDIEEEKVRNEKMLIQMKFLIPGKYKVIGDIAILDEPCCWARGDYLTNRKFYCENGIWVDRLSRLSFNDLFNMGYYTSVNFVR